MEGPPLPAARLANRHAGRFVFGSWLGFRAFDLPWATIVQSGRLRGFKGVLGTKGLVTEPLRGSVGEAQAAVVTRPIVFDRQGY
jgi:hypothetical protein